MATLVVMIAVEAIAIAQVKAKVAVSKNLFVAV